MEPIREPEVPALPAIQPLDRIAAVVEVILCSGFPTQILLIAILASAGMKPRTAEGLLSPPFVFTLSLVDTVLVIGLVLFFLTAHRESPRRVLLGQRAILREALLGVALVPAVFFLLVLVLMLILGLAPQLDNVARNPLEDLLRTRGDAIIFAVVAMVAGGVREEMQRGFIIHRFDTFLGGGAVGVVVYSALFGLGHIEQGYDAAIATGTLGAFWGAIYLTRRSVVAPMVNHAAFNLTQLVKYVAMR